jgi:hypothetical protein
MALPGMSVTWGSQPILNTGGRLTALATPGSPMGDRQAARARQATPYTTPRYEDEAGGSFKGQNPQRIVRPSLRSMGR